MEHITFSKPRECLTEPVMASDQHLGDVQVLSSDPEIPTLPTLRGYDY